LDVWTRARRTGRWFVLSDLVQEVVVLDRYIYICICIYIYMYMNIYIYIYIYQGAPHGEVVGLVGPG